MTTLRIETKTRPCTNRKDGAPGKPTPENRHRGKTRVPRLRRFCGCFLAGEDAHLAALGQKCDAPLHDDEETVGEANQKIDMYRGPHNPCEKSGEAHKPKIGQRVLAADDCKVAFIPIPEGRRGRLSFDAPAD